MSSPYLTFAVSILSMRVVSHGLDKGLLSMNVRSVCRKIDIEQSFNFYIFCHIHKRFHWGLSQEVSGPGTYEDFHSYEGSNLALILFSFGHLNIQSDSDCFHHLSYNCRLLEKSNQMVIY